MQITIKKFSCIDEASLEVRPLTVLIGPQASGKSVISKLIYFFISQIHHQYIRADEDLSMSEFKESFIAEFTKWFPPTAWGLSNFVIRFQAGPITFVVKRKRSASGSSERINVTFSDYFLSQYDKLLIEYRAAKTNRKTQDWDDISSSRDWEISFKIRNASERRLEADLGTDFVIYQLFIPAGRSFFTSVGKALSVFDHGGLLDPVTLRFGRLFSNYRERRAMIRFENPDARDRHNALMFELFGGHIKFDRDKEYVETEDGRKVPFAVMSSGQQELLPLWLTISTFSDVRPSRRKGGSWMIYIEEPEAHTFPTAQSLLVEYLAGLVSSPKDRRMMIITTHSPYVLSKINNLILGGKLIGKQRGSATRKVTPKLSWLMPGSVAAYGIVDRVLVNLIDADGLINADYLDSVSSQISNEFLSLLEHVEGE